MSLGRVLVTAVLMLIAVGAPIFAGGEQEPEASPDDPYHFTMAAGWGEDRMSESEQLNDPYFQYVEDTLGIAPLHHGWEWQGGEGYVEGLRLAMAGGEEFDMIMPWDEELTANMIDSGVAIPLDDLIDEVAPEIWDWYSDEDWAVIRARGDGEVMYLPRRPDQQDIRAGFIRKDWLDEVGMDVPTTREELVDVYRAFRDNDANDNGDPDDEIPVSGREGLRWLDDLFVMHGVAMYEGHPQWQWNPEEEILESAQVSDSMRMALEFIRDLIDEGLMDQEMPVLPAGDWQQRINGGRVGHYFHLTKWISDYTGFRMDEEDPDETGLRYWDVMSLPPKVPGVEQQRNIHPTMMEPVFMITEHAEHPELIMEWFRWSSSREGYLFRYLGIPGTHWRETDDGIEVIEELDITPLPVHIYAFGEDDLDVVEMQALGPLKVDLIEQLEGNTQGLDNTGMPTSVYDGHSDFNPTTARLYREYASRAVLGEASLGDDAWDSYVENWYSQGGDVVTERATEWYKDVHGID